MDMLEDGLLHIPPFRILRCRLSPAGHFLPHPLVWPLRAVVAFGYALFTLQILAEAAKSVRIISGRAEP